MNSLLAAIIASACLGALIGLIRQWSEQQEQEKKTDFGGVRTYTLWALLGCLGAHFSQHHVAAMLPVVLILIGAQLIAAFLKDAHGGHPGSTTFASAMLTGGVGALVNWGQTQPAVLVAALTMVILGIKQPLHSWTRNFTTHDIRATLQFVAITGVILPLVPNRAMGPYEAFNPYSTWLMVVLISGIGFGGYILMRLLGAQAGITVTGLAGGLASSTATTLAFSRRSREDPNLSVTYALAVVLACTVMPARVLVVIGMLNIEFARSLLVPLAAMSAPGIVYSAMVWFSQRRSHTSVETPKLTNPLSLATAVKFGLLYALFAFLVKAAVKLQWQHSLLPLSFLSGLTDMDAIALLMANNQAEGSVVLKTAAQAVIVAAIANSIVKAGLSLTLGSRALGLRVASVLGLTIAVGAAAFFWLV